MPQRLIGAEFVGISFSEMVERIAGMSVEDARLAIKKSSIEARKRRKAAIASGAIDMKAAIVRKRLTGRV